MRNLTNLRVAIMSLLVMMAAPMAFAIPADPTPGSVLQPDGTTLTLKLVGDEFFHYNTTLDGYTVLPTAHNGFEYAVMQNGQLAPSGMQAHDAALRTASEQTLLAGIERNLTGTALRESGRTLRARINGPAQKVQLFDYSKFRGLIILVNYNDKSMSMSNPNQFYDAMANDKNYTGFSFNGRWQSCTGSIRDYFYDQSMGNFDPHFDVVGPVNVDFACTDQQSTSNSWRIFKAVLDSLDTSIDFSQYDTDGDGFVDMVYFIVAGYSANYSGNNGSYLWPHKSFLYDYENRSYMRYDGVNFGTYACSTEIYGWESQRSTMPLGIGTICHEFSHVLGLPDLYDTDYDSSGGQSHHPGAWDVMASGGSGNYGRTPVGYSIWERYSLGWAHPQEITQAGDYTLRPVHSSAEGYILRTAVDGEFFMFDNRQQVKWDALLPGHGMIVARVDSTDARVWERNDVNINPERNYYELLRAGGSTSGASTGDAFPGTAQVTRIDNFTDANLKTWAGLLSTFGLKDIAEDNQIITFTVMELEAPKALIEDFEPMPLSGKTSGEMKGSLTTWNFKNAHVVEAGEYGNGEKAAALYKSSLIATVKPVRAYGYFLSFDAYNSGNSAAKFSIYTSTDNETWTKLNADAFEIPVKTKASFSQSISMKEPTYFRINCTAGSNTQPVYVDDFKILYDGLMDLEGDVNGDGEVDVNDVNILINIVLGKDNASQYGGRANVDGAGDVDVADVNTLINLVLGKN